MPHLWNQKYSLGATHIFGEVVCRLTSKIFEIVSAEKQWKYFKLVHGGKCPADYLSSCFNNYPTSSFYLCVQSRGTGHKLNAWKNRQLFTVSTRSLKRVTRGSPYMIGILFRKTLVNLLRSFL